MDLMGYASVSNPTAKDVKALRKGVTEFYCFVMEHDNVFYFISRKARNVKVKNIFARSKSHG